jgi:hypothetical protein
MGYYEGYEGDFSFGDSCMLGMTSVFSERINGKHLTVEKGIRNS